MNVIFHLLMRVIWFVVSVILVFLAIGLLITALVLFIGQNNIGASVGLTLVAAFTMFMAKLSAQLYAQLATSDPVTGDKDEPPTF